MSKIPSDEALKHYVKLRKRGLSIKEATQSIEYIKKHKLGFEEEKRDISEAMESRAQHGKPRSKIDEEGYYAKETAMWS